MNPDLFAYLTELLGPERHGQFLELRVRRRAGGMQQSFYSERSLGYAAEAIVTTGQRTDVYVGVAPRSCQSGGRDAVRSISTLWVDCDLPASVRLLESFRPAPAIVVRSGPHGRHAYWLLDDRITPDRAELVNQRLADVVRGDPRSTDPARILRPPSTLNFNYDPPAPVELERFEPVRIAPSRAVGSLAAPVTRELCEVRPDLKGRDDPLRSIEPAEYIRALLGVDAPRQRKIHCPLHADDSPSLHVYETAEGGWYCFGCGRGGSIFDLAALLWFSGDEAPLRGERFIEVRKRLLDVFVPVA